jgi:hypothetical protein
VPEVPKFVFCFNNGGDKLTNEPEKPHVQRLKSKFGTWGAELRLAGAEVRLASAGIRPGDPGI